ncbi:redox-sensing transcriptional repressor Rex [Deinococcus metallilatus]|uniref:Redox-sensing transcriptional repressor Rex n=2 Tax=Deinococcus TaxID=1298 RepID=A0AAJ5F9D6_9DEIO|nr:redox-sensing transcriptional repressor Rex [Deinococcus metallilatus]MBB5295021.1 redox-sensing transcriptional repressor [Deinococcus metallilatus]QBY09288.1 redox-sensing transcriptional repressor Rex [Deinococcus metallilatus]RXJ09293.1 redox-sensing transcriptional repressor Rex [Deinococcus metallilatus]TLK28815.1 redox-sensing transcriptional repressor Rex [Deinococcus metallilatus]GMA16954.1 redox-sensing transcriptional repressor Rex [Deinococcus metallilatus]
MTGIPTATISRLVTYLRILEGLEAQDVSRTSSGDLAERAGVTAFQVRKDLAYFGRFGTRGMGYTVPILKRELLRVLGLNQTWNVVIVGLGRLGQAIANYPGASDYQFQYVGLFDVNPELIGQNVRGLPVRHVDELREFTRTTRVDMGFLAVPPERAQDAAQSLADAGVRGILNFAPTVIQPRTLERSGQQEISDEWRAVIVENVDFLAGMKRLAFYILNPHLSTVDTEETE